MQIDAGKIIDDSPVRGLHRTIVAVGIFVLIVDAYDLVSMGIVIPRLSERWGMQPGEFGLALSLAMVGVMVGSSLAGLLGDYIGRRRTILITVAIAGLFMLLTVTAETMRELLIYRFFTGVGAGGCIPITIAHAAEYMPARVRNRLVVLMYTGAGMGSVLAGFAAPQIIAQWDWQGIFAVGGALSLLIMLAVLLLLPESLKFLIAQKADAGAISRLIRRLQPNFSPKADDQYIIKEHIHAERGSPMRELFGEGQTGITCLAWAVMLGNQFMVFLLALWMPTLFTQSGMSLDTSLYILALYNLGGVFGGWVFSIFADKHGSARVLSFTFPLAGVAMAVLGLALESVPLLIAAAILAGAFIIGSSFCLGPYVASLYPTRARSTGIGWALSIGRFGSIASPLIGGFAINRGLEISAILYFSALPPILCGLIVVWLNRLVQRAHGPSAG